MLKNKSDHISIKTEITSVMPVLYNESKYQVHEIRIFVKSLHTYNGQYADAEMFIHHKNENGGNDLLVCIPIVRQDFSNGESSEIFRNIFTELSKRANSKNSETVININTFSLNKLIPMKPFYSYKGTLPYKPCNGNYDIIVFNKNNGGFITMNDNIYSKLNEIITLNNYNVHKVDDTYVYYNELGPSFLSTSTSDEIFIDCQPTGDDGTSLVPVNKSLTSALSADIPTLSNLLKNKFVKTLITVLIIIIVLKVSTAIFKGISSGGSSGGGGATSSISSPLSKVGGGASSFFKKIKK